MPRFPALILGLLAAAAGCRSPQEDLRGLDSLWSGEALRAASLNAAIVRQATLYPYHFDTGAATLNELGRRDVALLAAHYRGHPGTLSVSRSGTPSELHAARLAAVRRALADAGLAPEQVALDDGLPGGDGLPSAQVLHILTSEAAEAPRAYAAGVDTTGGSVQP